MTKKAILVAAIGIVLAACAPSFAQGPFADVPIDHWAGDFIEQLAAEGINLPTYNAIKDEEILYVTNTIRELARR